MVIAQWILEITDILIMSNVQNCTLLICKYDSNNKFFAPPPPNPQTVPMAL